MAILCLLFATRTTCMDTDEIAKLRSELRANPDDADAHFRMGQYWYGRGEFERAAKEARCALRLGTGCTDVRLLLGKALMEQGHPREAAFQFDQLLKQRPGHAEASACQESIRRVVAVVDVIRRDNPPELQLDVRNHVVVLTLAGVLAPYTEGGSLHEAFDRLTISLARLLQLGQIGCVIDLSHVQYITSYFLGRLLDWRRKVLGDRYGMAICQAPEAIRYLLFSTRISQLITVVDTMDEGIQAVRNEVASAHGLPDVE
jgi:tetratricopeptide (TPR) repeat protein